MNRLECTAISELKCMLRRILSHHRSSLICSFRPKLNGNGFVVSALSIAEQDPVHQISSVASGIARGNS